MEEIDIRDILNYFLNKIIYFSLIVAAVVALFCVYYIFMQKPVYTSSTSIILTGGTAATDTITQTDLSVNSKLVSTYQEIVKSKRVLNQVITNLGLNYSSDGLMKMIKVQAKSETEIIEIFVTSPSNSEASEIANQLAKVFSREAKDLYNLSNVSILDRAETSNKPSNVNIPKQIIISLIVGIFLATIIIFITYYFDTTIKNSSDIERRYNFTILGNIPDYNKKKKGNKND